MQFSTTVLYFALFASSAVARPSTVMACVHEPRTIGCGTRLFPRCCTVEEWNAMHPDQKLPVAGSTSSTDATASSATLTPRGQNFVCTEGRIGCGSKMAPRCCTPEEFKSLHATKTIPVTGAPTVTSAPEAEQEAPMEQWPSIINDVDPTPTGPLVPAFTGEAPLENWPSIVNDVDPTPTGPVVPEFTGEAPLENWPSIVNDVDPMPTDLEVFPTIVNDVDPTPTSKP